MAAESLIITFSKEILSSSSGYCPDIMKQEEWDAGYVTKADIIKALEAQLFNGDAVAVECNTTADGGYEAAINTYPGGQDVGEMGLTNGTLGPPILENVIETEDVKFELTTEESTEYPIDRVISKVWKGEVWDSTGATIHPQPTITVEGDDIVISQAVYGTVTITYETLKYTRKATVSPANGSLDSVAWLIKDCGIEIMTLSPPTSAQADFDNNINCWGGTDNFGGDTDIDDSETPPDKPEAEPKDIVIKVDYCTQEVDEDYYG